MKKTMLQRLAALCLCMGLVSVSAMAAGTVYRDITVQYDNIKIVIDGVTITPRNANGAVVEPFIYNGTTYLPVRAVGNAIGKQVTWDGKAKTVYLGEAPGARKWMLDLCPPYVTYQYDTPSSFKMAGDTYTHGFIMEGGSGYAIFNLNGQYDTLSCDIGHQDGTSMNYGRFEIYLDGDLSQVIEVDPEDLVTHFDIPLHNALQLKILRNPTFTDGRYYSSGHYGFANCELS